MEYKRGGGGGGGGGERGEKRNRDITPINPLE